MMVQVGMVGVGDMAVAVLMSVCYLKVQQIFPLDNVYDAPHCITH